MPYADLSSPLPDRPHPLLIVGGFLLTILAGAINVSMLSFYAVPVSHMSGAVSRLGMDLGTKHFDDVSVIGLILGGFVLGCVLTGALVGSSSLERRTVTPSPWSAKPLPWAYPQR